MDFLLAVCQPSGLIWLVQFESWKFTFVKMKQFSYVEFEVEL